MARWHFPTGHASNNEKCPSEGALRMTMRHRLPSRVDRNMFCSGLFFWVPATWEGSWSFPLYNIVWLSYCRYVYVMYIFISTWKIYSYIIHLNAQHDFSAMMILHQLISSLIRTPFPCNQWTPNDQGTLEFPPGVTERFVEIGCHGCLSGEWKLDYIQGMSSGDIVAYLEYVCTCSVLASCFYVSLFRYGT